MTIRYIAAPAIAALVVSTLAACSDSFGPDGDTFEAVYALHTINGQEVPATIYEDDGEHYILVADTLSFSEDGTVARKFKVRRLSSLSYYPPDSTYEHVMELPYERDGNRVIIGYNGPCPPNALCIAPDEALFTVMGLRMASHYLPGYPTLMFHLVQ